jgi:hypothetical protein
MLFRWLFFFPSKIIDYIVIFLQLLLVPYFLLKVKNKNGNRIVLNKLDSFEQYTKVESIIQKARLNLPDIYGFQRNESHGLLQQAGNGLVFPEVKEKLLEQTIKQSGAICRRFPDDETHIGNSGDALSSWVFCYLLWQVKRPDLVKKVATHYFKWAFGMLWEARNGVSARSSNGGIAPIVDGWPASHNKRWWPFKWGIAQPITGPAFFTSQAILGLAKKELGGLWIPLYYMHWLVCGGWFYSVFPILHFKNELFYYTHQITAMNLWSLNKTVGDYKWGLNWLANKISPAHNAQPFICAVAWDAKAIDKDLKNKALLTLCNIKGAHFWPQHCPLDQGFLNGDKENNYTMAAMCAILLQKE